METKRLSEIASAAVNARLMEINADPAFKTKYGEKDEEQLSSGSDLRQAYDGAFKAHQKLYSFQMAERSSLKGSEHGEIDRVMKALSDAAMTIKDYMDRFPG